MNELIRKENEIFKEYFERTNGRRRVVCILDNHCVRYMVILDGKLKSRHEFSDDKKEKCFRNATKALNKQAE